MKNINTENCRILKEKLEKPIVLVGLMGAGKTRLGKQLSKILSLSFTDSDDEIIKAAGMNISDIFSRFGEDYFRDGERRVIARLFDEGIGVIAMGGGAVTAPDTLTLIKKRSVSVWVQADIPTLVERTGRRNTRPLLQQGDAQQTLIRLAEERGELYAQADIKIQTDQGKDSDILNLLVTRLIDYLDDA